MTSISARAAGQFVMMLVLLSGCRSLAGHADVPALVVQPDAKSRAELQQTLSSLFGGTAVRLADDALTRSSMLTLEAGASSGQTDAAIGGRIVTEPFRFRLVRHGDACVLIDLRDDSRHRLTQSRCMPE